MKTVSLNNKLLIAGGLISTITLQACNTKKKNDQKETSIQKKPNIILILADDMGFSDLGCYGGEAETPNLDRIASNGLRMMNLYNSARSCPSRASLLTGLYSHQADVGYMNNDRNTPGYRGRLSPNSITIPEVLKEAGYNTYMSGKWHLSSPGPIQRGFMEYWGLLKGGASYWEPKQYNRLPEDHETLHIPENEFYSTNAITDYALHFMSQSRQTDKPYFLYIAYNAPHFPLHAPKETIEKYTDIYSQGWDVVREKRYKRMIELGIIDEKWELSPPGPIHHVLPNYEDGRIAEKIPAWDELSPERQEDMTRRMAIYTAMIDLLDVNIGRLIADLEKNGELENTLILFISDNGASAEFGCYGFDYKHSQNILHTGNELLEMGQKGSYHSYGSGWANVSNTPWRMYKKFTHEGGISTPCIIHWPAGMKRKGEIDRHPSHIIDIMATCVEVAKATYPQAYNDHEIIPMEGVSLVPIFNGDEPKPRTIYWEHEGDKAVLEYPWKLVSYWGGKWELYNIEIDRTELNNCIEEHKGMADEMIRKWETWAEHSNVKPGLIYQM